MSDKVTAEQIKAGRMTMTLALDGDFYSNHYAGVEFPELVRVTNGPAGRKPGRHTRKFFVDGIEVPADAQAIADAINAVRSKRP